MERDWRISISSKVRLTSFFDINSDSVFTTMRPHQHKMQLLLLVVVFMIMETWWLVIFGNIKNQQTKTMEKKDNFGLIVEPWASHGMAIQRLLSERRLMCLEVLESKCFYAYLNAQFLMSTSDSRQSCGTLTKSLLVSGLNLNLKTMLTIQWSFKSIEIFAENEELDATARI